MLLEHWKPLQGELNFINVGTGIDLSIRELAEVVAGVTGYQGSIHWDLSKPDGCLKKQLDGSYDIPWLASTDNLE